MLIRHPEESWRLPCAAEDNPASTRGSSSVRIWQFCGAFSTRSTEPKGTPVLPRGSHFTEGKSLTGLSVGVLQTVVVDAFPPTSTAFWRPLSESSDEQPHPTVPLGPLTCCLREAMQHALLDESS